MGPTQPNVEPYILQYIPKAPNIGPKRGLPLHSTTLNYATLHHITLHYTALPSTTLHYIVTLHYTTLHYNYNYTTTPTTLHYTPLHDGGKLCHMLCKPIRQNMVLMLSKIGFAYAPCPQGKATSTPCAVPALSVTKNWVCTRSMPPHELEIKQA